MRTTAFRLHLRYASLLHSAILICIELYAWHLVLCDLHSSSPSTTGLFMHRILSILQSSSCQQCTPGPPRNFCLPRSLQLVAWAVL